MRLSRLFAYAGAVLLSVSTFTATAEGFRTPSTEIAQLLTNPGPAEPLVHAASSQLALLQYDKVIEMDRLMTPRLGLAGMRLDPITRITGIEPLIRQVQILDLNASGKPQKTVWQAPKNSRWAFVAFSPDGRYLSALQIETGKPARLWLFDIAKGKPKALTDRINPAWGDPCKWQDNNTLLCQMQTDQAAPATAPSPVPMAVEHQGKPLRTRTYAHLLETPTDDADFEFYFSSQLARIDLNGTITTLPVQAGVINRINVAPDGEYVVLRRILKPYPRLTSGRHFPVTVEVWRLADGERLYQSEPMGFGIEESDDIAGDPTSLVWGPQKPATAGFIHVTKNADGSEEFQWRSLQAPFTAKPTILVRSPYPIRQFGWTSAGTPWYASTDASQRVDVHVILASGDRVLWQDFGSAEHPEPGQTLRIQGDNSAVLEDAGSIFVAGNRLDGNSIRPYVERIDLASGKKHRLFTAEKGVYEQTLAILDPDNEIILTRREGETRPPQYFKVQAGRSTLLYSEPNPYPQLDTVERRQITYPRADGVTLTATLYLPPRTNKKPLPTLIWIYPREYTSNQAAEMPDAKPFRFHNIKGPSPMMAALAGYAVVMNPTMPIISAQLSDNQEYLPQLVSSAKAAVDYLVKEGISDPKRMAIGGRSYGAFSTANLLIHSNLFATGIAMSGAYNRTLTPFGFQHEKRTFWDATDYYASISPFFFANKVNEPILLVHGGADPNPGTPKIQARRFFHALVGEGATTRYVELPGEEHSYTGKDTVLHATWEMIDWLDRYLSSAAP